MDEKKGKSGIIWRIIAAVAVVLTVAAGIIFSRTLFVNPKRQLGKGLINMAVEMKAYTTSIREDIDFKALSELGKSQPVHSNVDLSFTNPEPSGRFDNVSLEFDALADAKNRRGKIDLKAGTYGMDVEIGSIVADNNTLYLASEQFLKGDVYSIDLENFGKDFNDSVWARYLDIKIPDDTSITLFGSGKDGDASVFAEIFKKHFNEMASSVKYDKIRDKKEFAGIDGSVRCGGVQVTISKDAYNAAMENIKNDILASEFYTQYLERCGQIYADDFGKYKDRFDRSVEFFTEMRAKGDIVLNFYIDKKGRIRNIATPENVPVTIKDSLISSVSASIDFTGGERTLDSVEGGICYYTEADGQVLELGISRAASVTADSYGEDLTLHLWSQADGDIIFSYINNWIYGDKSYDMTIMMDYNGSSSKLSARGDYEGIEKGKSYTLRIGNATLNVDTKDVLIASGTISTETAQNSQIEVPQNATELLKMSEMEIIMAAMKAASSFNKLQIK